MTQKPGGPYFIILSPHRGINEEVKVFVMARPINSMYGNQQNKNKYEKKV